MTVVACLGDSITEGSPYWDSRRRTRRSRRAVGALGRLAPSRARVPQLGIWGERTDEIAARFDEAVEGAEVLIVQGGINDIAQGRPIEPAAANLRALVERGLALGLRVAVCDVLPWNNGWPAKEAPIRALNALHPRARRAGAAVPRHARGPGRARADEARVDNADGDHPSVAGYRRLGELAFRLP